jgi:hypothetical protein
MKGADTIDEAVGQFYEDPNKYSHSPVDNAKETKTQIYSPPLNAPPANSMGGTKAYPPPPYAPPYSSSANALRRRPHTNKVIEAANIRARDEVRSILPVVWE